MVDHVVPKLLLTRRFHVAMADVDAAMILYYASPLRWAESVLHDWRREAGHSVSRMLREGWGSPVVRTEITYSRPLRLDDEVEATLWFNERSSHSFTVVCRFAAEPGGPVAVEVTIKQVTVAVGDGGEMGVIEVPAELISALESSASP